MFAKYIYIYIYIYIINSSNHFYIKKNNNYYSSTLDFQHFFASSKLYKYLKSRKLHTVLLWLGHIGPIRGYRAQIYRTLCTIFNTSYTHLYSQNSFLITFLPFFQQLYVLESIEYKHSELLLNIHKTENYITSFIDQYYIQKNSMHTLVLFT